MVVGPDNFLPTGGLSGADKSTGDTKPNTETDSCVGSHVECCGCGHCSCIWDTHGEAVALYAEEVFTMYIYLDRENRIFDNTTELFVHPKSMRF